mmetsp:Transcript_30326/g.93833  ORF Transcript_30326/g.93833 Transcript_30326/m.93833 type:complete len:97 (+) Transcript_30326:3316-3606(+)
MQQRDCAWALVLIRTAEYAGRLSIGEGRAKATRSMLLCLVLTVVASSQPVALAVIARHLLESQFHCAMSKAPRYHYQITCYIAQLGVFSQPPCFKR